MFQSANLTGNESATFKVNILSDGSMFDERGSHVEFAYLTDEGSWVECQCGPCVYERWADEHDTRAVRAGHRNAREARSAA